MNGRKRANRRRSAPGADWKPATPDGWTDVGYDTADGIAKITICRPEVRNAFRPRTLFELRDAFEIARDDPTIGVDRPHRRRARRVLLRWRPARARRRRLPRRQGHRPPQRARPPGADPAAAEAGDRDGRRVRDRRRSRAARRVRPHDRRRQRALRPDRPEGRLVRRRLRIGIARAHRRAEEGARDLVPVRAVRRAGRGRHGTREQGRAARRPRDRDGRVGAARCSSTRRSRCAC